MVRGSRALLAYLLFSIFSFLVAPLGATTVTGTLKRPDGTPLNGTIEFVLSQQAKTTTPPILIAPVRTTCAVSSGQIAAGCMVQGNDTLDPAGTYYSIRVLDANNRVVVPATNYTLAGASVDLGSLPVTATATLVPPSGNVVGNLNVTGNLTVAGSADFGADPQDFAHLRFLGLTADPATLGDGSVFYRSDLNRIRFQARGLQLFDGTQYVDITSAATNTVEFGGNVKVSGGTILGTSADLKCNPVPPQPDGNSLRLYCPNSDERLYYKDDTNTVLGPLAVLNDTQTWTSPQNFKTFNQVRVANQFAGADWCAKVAAAKDDLPSTGGLVVANFEGAQSACAANLTIDKAGTTITFLPGATYSLGTSSIVISANSVTLDFLPRSTVGGSLQMTYTGTGAAIDIGSDSALTSYVKVRNASININGAGSAAIGIRATRVQHLELENPRIIGILNGGTQRCIQIKSGTTQLSDEIRIYNPSLFWWGSGVGLEFVGNAGLQVSMTQVIGGQVSGQASPVEGTAVKFDQAGLIALQDVKIASASVGLDFVNSSSNNQGRVSFESDITTDIQFAAGNNDNVFYAYNGQSALTFVDNGARNSVWGAGVKLGSLLSGGVVFRSTNATSLLTIDNTGNILPATTGGPSLGGPSNNFKEAWIGETVHLLGGVNAFPSVTHATVYGTAAGGSDPHNAAGNLVLAARGSGALSDVVLATGNPLALAARVDSAGKFSWYDATPFKGTLTHNNTADRLYTFPDAAITVAGINLAQVFTAAGALTLDNQLGLRLREQSANGTDYIELRGPASLAAPTTYTWNVTGDCTANVNAGALTVNASKEIVCSDDDGGAGGGGDNVTVGGSAVTDANFSNTNPAAPADGVNVRFQLDTAATPDDISANLPFATGSAAGAVSTAAQTFAGQKTFTGGLIARDNNTEFQDDLDNSKKLTLQLSSIATATTHTWTAPNASGEVSLLGQTIEDAELASNYSGVGACTNQFVRTLNDNAAPTCAAVTASDADSTLEKTGNKNAASGYAGLTSGTKLTAAQGQEVWGLADLTDVAGTSGTGTTSILSTLTSLTANDLLKWSGTNWVNSTSAAKADALTNDPSDCSASNYATTIAANGNLTCAQPSASQVTNAFDLTTANTLTNVTAPGTPAAGKTAVWTDTTDKNLKAKDDAAVVSNTVRPTTCSGTDKVSAISSAGAVTCSADQGGGGANWEALANSADTATTYTSNNTAETVTFNFQAAFTTGAQFIVQQAVGNPIGGLLGTFLSQDLDATTLKVHNNTAITGAVVNLQAGNDRADILAGFQAIAFDRAFNWFGTVNPGATKRHAIVGYIQDSNATKPLEGVKGYAVAQNTAGNTKATVTGVAGEAYMESTGTITTMAGVSGFAEIDTAGTITDMASLLAYTNDHTAGTINNNYGLLIQNQAGIGTANYAIKTGTGSVDFGAATDLKVPVGAGAAPTTSGLVAYDSTANRLKYGENGTTRTLVGQATADTLTNKTLDAEATGNVITTVSKQTLLAAGCNNATAGPGWDLPTSNGPAAVCYGTSPQRFGALDFADGASALTSTSHVLLPADWTGAVDVAFVWFSGSTSTNSAVWTLATACVGDGEDLLAPTFNTTQTVADANNAAANTRNTASLTNITATGCAAGETLFLRIGRDPTHASDTLASTASLLELELTLRRAQ